MLNIDSHENFYMGNGKKVTDYLLTLVPKLKYLLLAYTDINGSVFKNLNNLRVLVIHFGSDNINDLQYLKRLSILNLMAN